MPKFNFDSLAGKKPEAKILSLAVTPGEKVPQQQKVQKRDSIPKKHPITNNVFEHLKNLTKGMKYYLIAWKSRYERYLKEKPGNPLIDEYEDMQETLAFLNQLKIAKKELKK